VPDDSPPSHRNIVLRDYQVATLNAAVKATATHDRVCIYGPTGSGKTEQGMRLVQKLVQHGKRVMWVVNRIELINQTSRRFLDHGIDHGVVQASHERTDIGKPVQICSIQTLRKRSLIPSFDVLIIDEAHGAISESYKAFIAKHPVKTFGLTATPFSKGLGKVFQTLVHEVTVADLTEQGWLVPARFFAPERLDLSGVKIVAGDYEEGGLEKVVNQKILIGNLVDEWLKRANDVRTIVFATSILHSRNIADQFTFRGVPAEHIDCNTKDDDRKAILDRLRDGITRVVSNCSVLAEGFDLPDLECIVLARPTQSMIRYLQMVGRVLRPAPGKDSALVLDHSNTVESLGFPTDELPLVLDDGKTKKKGIPKDKLHTCPKCKAVSQRRPDPCSECGYRPPRNTTFNIDQREGTLREIKRTPTSVNERQEWYSGYVTLCQRHGYNPGWVANKFREKFGVWPRNMDWIAGPPPRGMISQIQEDRRKYFRAKQAMERVA